MKRAVDFFISVFLILYFLPPANGSDLMVGKGQKYETVGEAVMHAGEGDKICITPGVYNEWDIMIDKPVQIEAEPGVWIDANNKGYGFIIKADNVKISGLGITNVGKSYTKDFAAIYLSRCNNFSIVNTTLEEVFFGILVEKSHYGEIKGNHISSNAIVEAGSGNGVHMWHSSDVIISNNELHNLRDGIYFEFVTNSKVIENYSHNNLRYGLHFMFSNNDEYHNNIFTENGAGVAVMFSKYIKMTYNQFKMNWGSASYGLLLKEIYDAEIEYNIIEKNTVGVYAEGSTRINYRHNEFIENGWAIKITGACYTNIFRENNFSNNSFDLSYNSKMNDNSFNRNYWSSYTGYDLDRNGIGDVPFRPVKLFSYIVNNTPETIVLLRSLFVMLINFSEKVSPVFTPDDLMDNEPLMYKVQ